MDNNVEFGVMENYNTAITCDMCENEVGNKAVYVSKEGDCTFICLDCIEAMNKVLEVADD